MSEARVIVHIGLPKTATTTLQKNLFPVICSGAVEYVGVFQPRGKEKQTDFYAKIYGAVCGHHDIRDVRSDLAARLDGGKSILISEEMISASGAKVSWSGKLANLGKILDGFDYAIIVTVREPASAMYSYYCELYSHFKQEGVSFFECAMNHEAMGIFRYSQLTNELLTNFDKEKIIMYKFEDIIAGKFDAIINYINPNYDKSAGVVLANNNATLRNQNFQATKHAATPLDLLRWAAKTGILSPALITRLKPYLHPILNVIGKIHLKKVYVKKPSNEEMRLIRKNLSTDLLRIQLEFGVKFD